MNRELVAVAVAVLIALPLKLVEFVILPGFGRPDLLMVLSISAGYIAGWDYGVPVGFGIGLLEDLVGGRMLGVRALSLAVAAVISASAREYVTPDAIVARGLLSGGAALISDLVGYGLLAATGRAVTFLHFLTVIRDSVIWSAILVLPVTYLLFRASWTIEKTFPKRKPGGRFIA